MTETQIESANADLRALRELKNSRGWALLMEESKRSILDACLQMADNPNMTEKEIDFRRGAISTARNYVNAPDAMIARLEMELLVASAEKQTQLNPNATA